MRTFFGAIGLAAILATGARADNLTGTVSDRDGNPIASATVSAGNASVTTGSDGRFAMELSVATVTLRVEAAGYYAETVEAKPPADISVHLIRIIPLRETSFVTSEMARPGETPRAFTDLTKDDIDLGYGTQDVPMLLAGTTNLYAYSDNGNGVGYSYLKIRGFDQRRVSVLINGIPHNDGEGGDVYWIDYPDVASGTESIQVQRGVGTTLAGGSNMGGFINVETARPALERSFRAVLGAGSFESQRYTLDFHSGLLDSKYAFYGRLSKIQSEGYRELSWTRSWSYFMDLERLGTRSTNRIQIFGGPEETHLAYAGVTREYLDGEITGDPREDRRANFLSFPGEIDHFNQPHVQWLSDWQLGEDTTLSAAVYYIKGSGYYEQFRSNRAYWQYDLTPFELPDGTLVERTDLVRRRNTDQNQTGAIARVALKRGRHEITAGASFDRYRNRHYGQVVWGALLPPETQPDHPYYDYRITKWTAAAYVRDSLRISEKLTGLLELQFRNGRYEMDRDQFKGVEFETGFPLVSPRVGLIFTPAQEHSVYFNFATSAREPGLEDIYDPQDPYGYPLFRESNPYRNPLVDPERVYDYEAGWTFSHSNLTLSATVFHMVFRNEVVYGGQIDENGTPITGNAERSTHQGVEISLSARIPRGFYLRSNASFNRNTLDRYTEFTWDGAEVRDGNRMGGFPEALANLIGGYERRSWGGALHLMAAGRQYLDNSENERRNPERRRAAGYVDKVIDPYAVVNLTAHYRLPTTGFSAVLRAHFNNIFDKLYEPAGYVDEGTPYWIPAAGRNWFATLEICF